MFAGQLNFLQLNELTMIFIAQLVSKGFVCLNKQSRNAVMLKKGFVVLLMALSLMACENASTPLERSAQTYLQQRDVNSLRNLAAHLQRGMPKHEVDALLGQPNHSPMQGQYHYATSGSHTLVLDYRDKGGNVTDMLQGFWIARSGK